MPNLHKRRKDKEAVGRTKSVDVILPESLRDHAECLKQNTMQL